MDFAIPEELEMLQRSVRRFVKDKLFPLEGQILVSEEAIRKGEPPVAENKMEELRRTAMRMGLWAIGVPEEWGGGGLDTLGLCLVTEELARSFAPFDFGDVNPVLFECSHEQREKYLLPTVMGERRPCFALREPRAGVCVEAFETTAAESDHHYVLNGRKLTTPPREGFDFAVVFAVTDREKGRRGGITCFLLDEGTAGFSLQRAESTGHIELLFRDCQVPMANVLGEVGQGLYLGKEWFPRYQIMAAARCVGATQRILEMCTLRVQMWEAFGRRIAERKAFRGMVANMVADIRAARLMVYYGAWKINQDMDSLQDVAIARLFATEMVARAVDRAVRIHSGPGCAEEPIIRALYRNAISAEVAEETLANHRTFIASQILDLVDG